ncbi:mannose-1-phosphate guanylyltransferase/mannose-6-phosphate isomerase [Achromobacter marplatensis]|jgi:mannose-1-phosphate guanylyltransferase/mannose-6-phosphate isomerase|uniref:mannose-1-phosphate guanylyltransferase/mannose-6-phosphate isomerase n=1 Tax=Achromobacter marplatensis TaxID=470868 RepID=UPI0002780D15|nr:mannose-1-phosphate guanylyltransferase/mannose-6-phosphate isomerase [Achromobacter marplatensis]EJO33613.1 mannose-1-phosphate guanylyltransferase/mannose-6-phosphate isomerase [Achromobacter marplatensis]
MANDIIPVVLCGGAGTRLWPLSRTGFPKQFLVFDGTTSLFQNAVQRINDALGDKENIARTLVVTNEEHRFLMLDQLRELPLRRVDVILEPVGKNTAPAMTLAALEAVCGGGDPVLVVTPADQSITDEAAYGEALRMAVATAEKGGFVVLGIEPTHAETGYGYIRHDTSINEDGVSKVLAFAEKPDSCTATEYLKSGDYLWNAGMFVVRASVWLEALKTFRNDIFMTTAAAWEKKQCEGSFLRPHRELFTSVPAESIDYAVVENCAGSEFEISVVKLSAGWSDLGAWDAVWDVAAKDDNENVIKGNAIVLASRNSYVHASSRLIALLGVDDVVVVDTPDALLVASRDRAQEVKEIVAQLKAKGSAAHEVHRKVHRPWGWYDEIEQGDRFKVKRIMVKSGASLSLQMHHHRAEHWVIVKGTAEITCGERIFLLTENQSTFIPLGEKHRLHNPGAIPLEMIEVQSGTYLGEDDIVRYSDNYGRG